MNTSTSPQETIMDTPTSPQQTPIVFRMNDCDWWVGHDLDSVKKAFARDLGYRSLQEAEESGLFEAPAPVGEEELAREFAPGTTLRDLLEALQAVDAKFPCFFSSVSTTQYWSSTKLAGFSLNSGGNVAATHNSQKDRRAA